MNSIFEVISSEFSYLERNSYSRPSMLAISHAIENLVTQFQLASDLFVTFQKFEFFLYEKERYLQLEKYCRKVFVFAQGIEHHQVIEFSNTIFVEIHPESPLADEWVVLVNHPKHPILLATTEIYDQQIPGSDDFRYFRGFLSFSLPIIKAAVKQCLLNLRMIGIEYIPCKIENVSLTPYEKEVNQKIYLFINQLLEKVEQQVSQVLTQNTMLQNALTENKDLSFEMVRRLCYAAEFRDEDAGGHLARISSYAELLYSMVETNPQQVEYIRYASLMHDIGKIGIPDAVLRKSTKYTPEEFEIIKSHPVIGSQILRDSSLAVIQMGCIIAYNHHEKWDGSGYPRGLKGKEIPLVARIVSLVDVFDALSSKRIYKEAFPIEECLQIIRDGRNKHFDGELVDLFLANIDQFLMIRENNQ